MSSFQDFLCLTFTITLRQQPKGITCSGCRTKTGRKPVLRRLHLAPLGCSLRVIVNVTHRNLEKTTSSVLPLILIHLWMGG